MAQFPHTIIFRCTAEEAAIVEALAEASGQSASAVLRECIDAAIERLDELEGMND